MVLNDYLENSFHRFVSCLSILFEIINCLGCYFRVLIGLPGCDRPLHMGGAELILAVSKECPGSFKGEFTKVF